jgi:hypothetical protein
VSEDLLHRTHPEVVKRLRRAEGHLRSTMHVLGDVAQHSGRSAQTKNIEYSGCGSS